MFSSPLPPAGKLLDSRASREDNSDGEIQGEETLPILSHRKGTKNIRNLQIFQYVLKHKT